MWTLGLTLFESTAEPTHEFEEVTLHARLTGITLCAIVFIVTMRTLVRKVFTRNKKEG